MSAENVQLVRTQIAEFTQTQQANEERLAPDFVWDLRSWQVWTGQAEFHGADGFRDFFAEWTDAYEEWTQEVEEFIDLDDSRVLVTMVQRGRLRGSGSWVELRAAFLWTVKDSLVTRIEVYNGPEQALEAAGLSE